MNNEFKIKFWGVRGSYPSPGANTVKYGGNTACVQITVGEKTIILDAGTGIIPLGRALAQKAMQEKRELELLLLFSHLHHDHTQGFPFFVPAYLPKTKMHIYGPGGTAETVKHVLEHNQSSETFPISLRDMASSKDIQSLCESQIIIWDESGVRVAEPNSKSGDEAVVIKIYKSYAHPGGVYVYRITYQNKSIVYATDTEGYVGTDRKLIHFSRNADVLIHDAQYREEHYFGSLNGFPATQGYGHSTASMAGEVAASAETGKLILFHHDPAYSDDWVDLQESRAKKIFLDSYAAYEGLEISLNPSPVFGRGAGAREGVQYVENG